MSQISILINLILLIICAITTLKAFKINPLLYAILANLIINMYGMYLSVILIENGSYISEQGIIGYENYSSIYLLIFILIINIYIINTKFDQLFKNGNEYITVREFSLKIQVIILISFALFTIINKSIISVQGQMFNINRFNPYVGNKYSNLLIYLSIYLSNIMPLIMLRLTKYRRIIFIIIWIIYGMSMMSTTGVIRALIVPLSVIFVLNNKKINVRMVLLIAILIFIALFIKSLEYRQYKIYNIYFRMILQGHLFWGSIQSQRMGDIVFQIKYYIIDNLRFKRFETNINYGFGYLMYLISGDLAVKFIKLGVRMTSGMPAILIVNFGVYLSFLIYIIILNLYIKTLKYYTKYLLSENIILFIIISKIFHDINEFMIMGEYGYINIRLLVWLVMLIILKKFILKIYSKYFNNSHFHVETPIFKYTDINLLRRTPNTGH
jgi:hypothetical protein